LKKKIESIVYNIQTGFHSLQSILIFPLKFIYYNGPSRLGFWNGKDSADACSEITRVPAEVWRIQDQACTNLLGKDFTAFCIGLSLLCSGVFLCKYTEVLMWRAILYKKKIKIN
jgi:hypothetical protein